MKVAYEVATQSEPFLPHGGSLLPALLAMRKTHRIIQESRAYLASQKESLEKVNKRLELEREHLEDQRRLHDALQDRIKTLRAGVRSRMKMTPEQVAQEKAAELKRKKREYDKDTSKMLRTLNDFVEDHLGAMLAAEDLGGPVVGDMMDIDVEGLSAGFTHRGTQKKPRKEMDVDKRQRRIDDIWGDSERHRVKDGGDRDEGAAAAQEMRGLVESLLNSLIGASGDSSASYVEIPRESAAIRFLVRSKVAQFHPRDSSRARLLDFGRELDD